MMTLRTLHFGIGAIGSALAREALLKPDLKVLAAFDADPAKVGRDLGQVIGLGRDMGIRIASPEADWPEADVLLHTTASHLPDVLPQLELALNRRVNVLSSCEELAFPYRRYPDVAAKLDRLAKERGVSLLATGVNPGFVMDTLPIALSAVSCDVQSVKITRVLDAADRRQPFQLKIGAGLSQEEFAERAATGHFGHIGLGESAMAIASAFGWEPYDIEDTLEAVIAERALTSAFVGVQSGDVAGLHQRLLVRHRSRVVITMELVMAMGQSSRDEIEIEGDPPVRAVIHGGLHGDRSTVGIMINAARALPGAPPGLLTMRDIPPVHWKGTR